MGYEVFLTFITRREPLTQNTRKAMGEAVLTPLRIPSQVRGEVAPFQIAGAIRRAKPIESQSAANKSPSGMNGYEPAIRMANKIPNKIRVKPGLL